MRYRITHTTQYHYSSPVRLQPHILRLCPRSDGAQWLQQFDIAVMPEPIQQHYFLDTQGNTCLHITFNTPLDTWQIKTVSEVSTQRENPFDYLSQPWAVQFPIDYPSTVIGQLRPYLDGPLGAGVDDAIAPEVLSFARQIKQEVDGNVGYFLTRLTQRIGEYCEYERRIEGHPRTAAVTLEKRAGTCRDFTVLFMAVCRSVGLAARFVSGYQEGDLSSQAAHDLHAWAEVYVPGGGWRGFDPTLGLAVSDRHITLAAALQSQQAAPVSGTLYAGQRAKITLKSQISLEAVASC